MGCAVSRRPSEVQEMDEISVVNLCKERKKLIKSAVETRYSLAGAHCKYYQSLYGVALAIRLFVSRHSSDSSPFLITYPQSSKFESKQDKGFDIVVPNSMYLQHTPSLSITHEANSCKKTQDSLVSSPLSKNEKESHESEMEDDDDDDLNGVCEHFYDPPVAMQNNQFGWDFFGLFDNGVIKEELVDRFSDKQVEKEREEKVVMSEIGGVYDVKVVSDGKVREVEELKLNDKPTGERELLEALKDVEDHFIRAYESGVELSKMLDTNMIHQQPAFQESKGNSNKLIKSVTRTKSILSRSTSSRSFLSSSSRSSLTWEELSTDIFEEYGAGGMESGSHSSTLGRLYAWEKKLCEEVKAGEELRKMFERKYSQLSKNNTKGDEHCSEDKTTADVRDLYSRICVRITSAGSISRRIQRLRDEELQPQLVELLHGLTRTWMIMLEVHQTQNRTMSEVKYFSCPALGKFSNDSHHLATLQLEAAVQNWQACFTAYFSAQMAYIEALNGWLSKLRALENEYCSWDISLTPDCKIDVPQLLTVCHHWLASMEKLPNKVVESSMKSLVKDIRTLWLQQGVEQQQKRKLDGLSRELDRQVSAFQKAEKKMLEMKLCDQKVELDIRHRVESLEKKKGQLDMLRTKLELEKEMHQVSIQETEKVILNGFQTGFSSVFYYMAEFSEDSLKMCNKLLAHGKLPS